MKYRRTNTFHKAFAELPEDIKEKARQAFSLFTQDQRHPSLHTKKIKGTKGVWEGRVDRFYRFTFHYEQDEEGQTLCVFRNIGRHDIVDREP